MTLHHFLQVAARTYSLALSLTLGPALLSLLTSRKARHHGLTRGLSVILGRELGITSFSFAITVAIGGGSALRALWESIESGKTGYSKLSDSWAGRRLQKLKTYVTSVKSVYKALFFNSLSSFLAIMLMQSHRRSLQTQKAAIPWTIPISPPNKTTSGRTSATLDLTLLLMVRALDAVMQAVVFKRAGNEGEEARTRRQRLTTGLDALLFWASSARSHVLRSALIFCSHTLQDHVVFLL